MTKNTPVCCAVNSGSLGIERTRCSRVSAGNDLVLSECDVSVRLSRGAALITRWLDAESKIMVLGTTSSKWPGLSPPEWPAICPSTLTILTFARNKKLILLLEILASKTKRLLGVRRIFDYCMFSLFIVALHFGVNFINTTYYLTHL